LEKIDENGKSKKQNMLDKQHITKIENNSYKIGGEKTKQTRLQKDENGLNSYEKLSMQMTLSYNIMKGDTIIEENVTRKYIAEKYSATVLSRRKDNPLGSSEHAKKILKTQGKEHLIGLYLIQI